MPWTERSTATPRPRSRGAAQGPVAGRAPCPPLDEEVAAYRDCFVGGRRDGDRGAQSAGRRGAAGVTARAWRPWTAQAATTPPTAPNRWPCQETPGVGTRSSASVEP